MAREGRKATASAHEMTKNIDEKTDEQKPAVAARFLQLDREIKKDQEAKASWGRWRKRFGIAAAVAAGSIVLLKAAPVVLVMGPIFIASAIGFGTCWIARSVMDDKINEKYTQQAQLAAAYEQAKNQGPDAESQLEKRLTEEFGAASTLNRIEKAIESLRKSIEGKPASLDKPLKPADGNKIKL